MYEAGLGTCKDMKEALHWHGAAAERGDAEGQLNLGTLYFFGRGVGRDYSLARKWLHKSAEQGHRLAQIAMFDIHNADAAHEQGQ